MIVQPCSEATVRKQLAAANVERAGKTARSWNFETSKVQLTGETSSLQFEFSLRSKGGGITDVRVTVGANDFLALAESMAIADRGAAMRHMAATLSAEIARQAEHEKLVAREARSSVKAAADKAFLEAPAGRNHAERLTRDMVSLLVKGLNSSGDTESAAE